MITARLLAPLNCGRHLKVVINGRLRRDEIRALPAICNVTLAQLRAFEPTVRLGGIHAAARHVGLTQPAVSRRIRELEPALEIKVFVRSGGKLRISPDGAALFSYANELLSTTEEMAVRLSIGDPLRGTLRFGVSGSFSLVELVLGCRLGVGVEVTRPGIG